MRGIQDISSVNFLYDGLIPAHAGNTLVNQRRNNHYTCFGVNLSSVIQSLLNKNDSIKENMLIKETFFVKEHIKHPFPEDMHKIIMRSLEHSNHLSPLSPRSDAGILWSYNSQDNLIVIQHDTTVSIHDKDFHKIS